MSEHPFSDIADAFGEPMIVKRTPCPHCGVELYELPLDAIHDHFDGVTCGACGHKMYFVKVEKFTEGMELTPRPSFETGKLLPLKVVENEGDQDDTV